MNISKDKVSQYLEGLNDILIDNNTHVDLQKEKIAPTISVTEGPNRDEAFDSGTQISMREKVDDLKTVSQDISYDDIKVVKVHKYRLYKKGDDNVNNL